MTIDGALSVKDYLKTVQIHVPQHLSRITIVEIEWNKSWRWSHTFYLFGETLNWLRLVTRWFDWRFCRLPIFHVLVDLISWRKRTISPLLFIWTIRCMVFSRQQISEISKQKINQLYEMVSISASGVDARSLSIGEKMLQYTNKMHNPPIKGQTLPSNWCANYILYLTCFSSLRTKDDTLIHCLICHRHPEL